MKWLHTSDVFTETKCIDFCIEISQIIERKYDACLLYRFRQDMRTEHDIFHLKFFRNGLHLPNRR